LLVNTSVPVKVVRLGPRDRLFITPVIKQLLRKQNYLRRRARYLEANSLAEKINLLITQSKSSNLNKLANANPKQLWAAVKGSVNSGSRSHSSGHPLLNDVHAVNDFLPIYLFILVIKVALRLHLINPTVLKFL